MVTDFATASVFFLIEKINHKITLLIGNLFSMESSSKWISYIVKEASGRGYVIKVLKFIS